VARRQLIKKTPLDGFLWGITALPLGVYVIVQDLNIPLIVEPQLFGPFLLLSWGQYVYYYGAARSRAWCVVVLCGTLALWGTLEAALAFCSPRASGNLPLTFPLQLGVELVRACYELKSRKVDEEPRIQKKLIPKFIFKRSEAQPPPFFFFRKVDKKKK